MACWQRNALWKYSSGVGGRGLIIHLTVGMLFVLPCVAAEPRAGEALLKAQVEAGEFAPALRAAQKAETVEVRDAWLAQIAFGQGQAGARGAAFNTASMINSDQTRSQTLGGLGAGQLGGGGTQADFDSLIELITSTVKPTSWDSVGGAGSIAPFPTGVYVDPQGVLRPNLKEETGGSLAALRAASARRSYGEDARRRSALRKVSLVRLEKEVQLRLAAGQAPSEEMQVLAGLQRIKYVFVYPDSGDIVLAGPAGDWRTGDENLIVSADSGQPVVRLDDLVVILRQMIDGRGASFGCLIVPRQESLARFQEFVKESNKRAIRPEERKAWLAGLRAQLGKQDIEVYGLDPRTRAAWVMVEADYHMKLVGMGLAEGVPGVRSYLDMVKIKPGGTPPPMGVLRWWFTLNYEAVEAAKDRSAFAFSGQGVKVLSENERLTAEGQRIHTGESDELTKRFAQSFTENFEALAVKYPIYGELRNLCDLALACALIREEDMAGKTGWHITCFGSGGAYPLELRPAPKSVESVVNYRNINGLIVAGVSGGVRVDPAGLVASHAIQTETGNALSERRSDAALRQASGGAWWWD